MSFVHLHLHSEYSLSSSLLRLDELIPRVAEMAMPALALTDWGNLYGALAFMKATKEKVPQGYSLKPIYGVEVGIEVDGGGSQLRHVVLLAKNLEGFENLRSLVSKAHLNYGFEGELLKPRLPLSELLNNPQGLILLSGGLKGILSSFFLQDQEQLAKDVLEKLKNSFKDDLYLELLASNFTPQVRANQWLVDVAKREGLPLVAAADVHYLTKEDAAAQEVWMMVAQRLRLDENPRSVLNPADFYLKSPEQMRESFSENPEACENTLRVAEKCNVKLSFKDAQGKRIYYLPDYLESKESSVAPATSEGAAPQSASQSQSEFFAVECRKGLERRFTTQKIAEEKLAEYKARLEFEIDVITKMGFPGYYLIVSDFIRWAKANGVVVGPGRGSGAGSLAAYALDIVDVDPIEHGLLFERFLNPERVSLPDFDIDFCQARRHEVIRYVSEKYGKDRVCQIVTFAKAQSKNALKDVGRVVGLSFAESNRLTKLIPVIQAKPLSIDESLEQVEELRQLVASDPRVKQTVDIAKRIEGALRQPGVHAAGVIIAGQKLEKLCPLSRDVNGNLITQWDMKMSEEAGLVKFDFLGLVTLDHLDLACKLLQKRNIDLNPYNIPIHDKKALEMISRGDTLGLFQLEGSGMQNLCQRMKPDCFADIAVINALFRPGPLESGMVDDFIARKHGKAKIEVIFPEMGELLKETYGVIVYQEQVLELAKRIAGYSLGGADLLRRAMGKKIKSEMEEQRSRFIEGAKKNAKDAKKAGELFDLIEKFAGYGFNKSHAVAYGFLMMQTAYLKAHYPTEFYTALLTIEKDNLSKMSRYIMDARMHNIAVLPPDVNESELDFSIVQEGVIRFGLSAVKNVGEGAVEGILKARTEGAKFGDLFDFVSRVESKYLNKRLMECLIQTGAMDSFELPSDAGLKERAELRSRYLATLERAMEWAAKEQNARDDGQASLFELESFTSSSLASKNSAFKPTYEKGELLSERQLFDWEKEFLGIYVSGSPLDKYRERAKALRCVPLFELSEMKADESVTVCGIISELAERRIKRGKSAGQLMGILKIDDGSATVEMVSFAEHYREFAPLFKSGQPLVIRADLDFEEEGKPRLRGGKLNVNGAPGVEDLTQVRERWPRKIKMNLSLDKLQGFMPVELLYSEISKVLKRHSGPVPVELVLMKAGTFETQIELGQGFGVHPDPNFIRELSQVVTIPGCVRVEAIH